MPGEILHSGMLACSGVDQERMTFPANWLTTAPFCRSVIPVYQDAFCGGRKKVSVRNPDGRLSASLIAHLGIDECHNGRMRMCSPISTIISDTVLPPENL
jgi:hypothetical protein